MRRAYGPVGQAIGAQKLGSRLVVVPPGKRAWQFHLHHANEEMFVILTGTGTLRYGEDRFPLREGDVVAAPPGTGQRCDRPSRGSLPPPSLLSRLATKTPRAGHEMFGQSSWRSKATSTAHSEAVVMLASVPTSQRTCWSPRTVSMYATAVVSAPWPIACSA